VNSLDQRLNGETLLHDSARSQLHRCDGVFHTLAGGQHYHFGASGKLPNVVECPAFHLEIEHEDIAGCTVQHLTQTIGAIDLSNNLHVALTPKQRFQAIPEEGVIVCNY
jgi:hypothetical protein